MCHNTKSSRVRTEHGANGVECFKLPSGSICYSRLDRAQACPVPLTSLPQGCCFGWTARCRKLLLANGCNYISTSLTSHEHTHDPFSQIQKSVINSFVVIALLPPSCSPFRQLRLLRENMFVTVFNTHKIRQLI